MRLSPPEPIKASRASTFLASGDLNGDGLPDLVTVDNDKSVIELFIQKASGEKRFERREHVLEQVVYSLSVADLNGDGRDDILLGSRPTVIIYQDEKGRLGETEEIRVAGMFAAAGDLNGDGRCDVVVFDKDRFSLLLQTQEGRLDAPREYPNAVACDKAPLLADLNGDGRTDLIYGDSRKKSEIAVRYQQEDGQFGPERKLSVGFHRCLAVLRRRGKKGPSALVTVEQRTNAIKLMEFVERPARLGTIAVGSPQLLALAPEAGASGISIVMSDLDGDGLDDLAVFGRDMAEAIFYSWGKKGGFSRRTTPVLADVVAAVAPAGISRPPLFLLSKKEKMIGVMRPGESGAYSLPQPIEIEETPLALGCGDLDGDGKVDLLYCRRNAKGTLEIRRWLGDTPEAEKPAAGATSPTAAGRPAAPYGSLFDLLNTFLARATTASAECRDPLVVSLGERSKEDQPRAINLADLNGDGLADMVVFFEYRPLEIFLQDEAGRMRKLFDERATLKGMFSGTGLQRFSVCDIDGDGRPEILVGRERFARALRIGRDGKVAVVEQFNGKNANARIVSVASGDIDGDGRREILLLDRANKVVTIYARDKKDAPFSLAANVDIPDFRAYRLLAGRLNNDRKDDIVVAGERALAVLFGGADSIKLTTRWHRQAETEKGCYALVETADIDGDGDDEILAVENKDHVLEFYRVEPGSAPQLFYKFKVFDDLRPQRLRQDARNAPPEPREIWIGDLNGDRHNDLVLLAHDRLLIYRHKP